MTSSVSAAMEACAAGSPATTPGWNTQNGFLGKYDPRRWRRPVVQIALCVGESRRRRCRRRTLEMTRFICRCEYLLQEKGQEFVHQIQARFPRLFEQVG